MSVWGLDATNYRSSVTPRIGELLSFSTVVFIGYLRSLNEFGSLNWEESIFVSQAVSSGWYSVIQANGYLIVTQRILLQVTLLFPLSWAAYIMQLFATLFWGVCSLTIFRCLQAHQIPFARSWVAVSLVALAPAPLALGHGLVMGSWWIQLLAMHFLIASHHLIGRKSIKATAYIFIALTCVSNPVSFSGFVTLLFVKLMNNIALKKLIAVFVILVMGTFLNLLANLNGKSILDLLPTGWQPNTPSEFFAFRALVEAGASSPRQTARVGLLEKLHQIPGFIKFLGTQFWPDPLRSYFQTSTRPSLSVVVVAIPLLVGGLAIRPFAHWKKRAGLLIPISFGGISTSVSCWLLVQDPFHFQYSTTLNQMLIIVLVVGTSIGTRQFLRTNPALRMILVIGLAGLAINIGQQFQDTSRGSADVTWHDAVLQAAEDCRTLGSNEVVVINQSLEAIGASLAPVVVRCSYLSAE